MHRRSPARLIAALLSVAPALAVAQSATGIVDKSQLTYTAAHQVVGAGNIVTGPQYQTPVGSGFDGVASLELTTTQGRFICTGSLLSDRRTILTAGHCITGATSDPTFQTLSVTANFYPNGSSPIKLTSTDFFVHPLYSGEVIDENDIALIRLPFAAPVTIQGYDLFTGDAVGQDFTFAGYGQKGSFGDGVSIGAGFSLANRRKGMNTFDVLAGDPRWEDFWPDPAHPEAVVDHVLLTDFDDGSTGVPSHDAMCVIGGFFPLIDDALCDPGLGLNEADTGGGDSGGPGFINGKIASVTSFGLTFGFLDPTFPYPDIDDELNSSFGEFAGFTNVSYHSAWIGSNLVAAPEPSTYVMLGSGLVVLFGVARRRRA